jgi:hypothetical protein
LLIDDCGFLIGRGRIRPPVTSKKSKIINHQSTINNQQSIPLQNPPPHSAASDSRKMRGIL